MDIELLWASAIAEMSDDELVAFYNADLHGAYQVKKEEEKYDE